MKGGSFLPTTAKYIDLALFAGITWINKLLTKYPINDFPNITGNIRPILPKPLDNEGDVARMINDQTPTFDLLSPDYDILHTHYSKSR
jgi:hypothetical protein